MADDRKSHPEQVDRWLKANADGLDTQQLLELFQKAFQGLWDRAHGTLSEITLMAICDRVLYTSVERYPFLSSITLNDNKFSFAAFAKQANTLNRDELREAFRFMLIEFLAINGSLTGQVITPALHAQLSKTTLEKRAKK